MAPTLTTKLEAVNEILAVIGEQPVNSLIDLPADAAEAERTLDRVNREIQSQGWRFNTECEVELTPNVSDEIVLASNVTRAWVPKEVDRYVYREGKLYNITDGTFTITSTLKVNQITLHDFDDIPETARRFILIRAARIFQDRVLADQSTHTYTRINEEQARAQLIEEEQVTGMYNLLHAADTIETVRRVSPLSRMISF